MRSADPSTARRSERASLLVWAAVPVWAALAGMIGWRFAGRAADDFFIIYRYVDNLTSGRGFAFNPGEPVFGITDPGWGLVLAALRWTTGMPIPLLGTLATGAALVGLAAVALRGGIRAGDPLGGVIAGTLVVGSPYLWSCQGSGVPLALVLLGSAALCRRGSVAGAVAGLAAWCRPDALLGVGLLGLLRWHADRRPQRDPHQFHRELLAYAASAGGVLLAGAVAAHLAFGSLVPGTMVAKRYFAARNPGSWLGLDAFWGTGWRAFARTAGSGAEVLGLLGLGGQLVLWRRWGNFGRLVALYAAGVFAAYLALGVPFFRWYGIPIAVALFVGVGGLAGECVRTLGADSRARHALRPGARRLAAVALAAVLLAGALAAGAALAWWNAGPRHDWRVTVYRQAGEWLREHSPPDARLAFHEVGTLAFHADREVVDLLGLVSPAALPYARHGDVEGAFLLAAPDYYLRHTFRDLGVTRMIVRRPWFRAAFAEAARFTYPGAGSLVIFARRPGAELPPPRPPRRALPVWAAGDGSQTRSPAH